MALTEPGRTPTITPERWPRVKEVLHQAWEQAPGDRPAFLNRICADDLELRSQVQQLLDSDANIGEFMEVAAIAGILDSAPENSGEHSSGRRIGPYRVLREIGHGGMGIVYLGERADGQYRKQVAIKLVGTPLAAQEITRRFRNERQVLAALDHPYIASLLDGGVTGDGVPYLVMEYVDGVRIDTWCDGRKLTVRDRLKLFRKVCAAVQFAHEKQVIHRDLKPGNILVTADGSPKLLDFGIAKVLDPELSDSAETTAGPAPMTPEYASPEQVRGERVGPASDIYSLGVVLYNLLSGQLPYAIQTGDLSRIARIICEQEPAKPSAAVTATPTTASESRGESPTGLRRRLTGDLDNVVLKALRKEPERRYSSVAQFSDDIDRYLQDLTVHARTESLPYRARKFLKRNRVAIWAAVITALLVLGVVAALSRLTRTNPNPDSGIRSIAVLPLENLSGDREQEYFADGITDALINELARIRALRVISRTSVMSFKGVHRRLPDIAYSLGVQTIAEGSVLRSGNRVRISVRLVDAPQERSVWSGSYEGELQNVLALQQQVAGAIAEEIHVTLTARNPARTVRDQRVDLGAYDAYLRGRHQYLSEFTQASIDKATVLFRQALTLDPSYAPAYAGLAECYYMVSNIYYAPTVVMPKAKSAALKALELDDTLAEAHAILALVESVYDFKRAEAEKEFRRAIELQPSGLEAHFWYGQHLAGIGRFDEAVAEMEMAQKLDPASPGMNAYVLPLYLARRYDQAIQRLEPITELHPEYHMAHAYLALAYEGKQEWAKATAEMERAYALDREPEALAQLGHIYALSGRTPDARRVLSQLNELSQTRYVSAYNIALVYAGLGERDEAFRWWRKADADRSEWFAIINVDPRLDAFHSDPRWAGILRSVGLEH